MSYLDDMFGVHGKTALVTGGATGIGRMIATGLAHGGARVLIASRKGEDCARVADEINAEGPAGKVEGFGGDVGTAEGVQALAAEVASRTDKLHILFNNAGITWGAELGKFPRFGFDKVMNVNVAGLFDLTQALMPIMTETATDEDPARVINLGSVMGHWPLGDGAYSYSASKAAVHHLTKILAKELAPRRFTVNAFAPGPFQSNMTAFATASDEQAAAVGSDVPLGRIGIPSDIQGASLFLCSKAGAYTTGCILPLDGGLGVVTGGNLFEKGLH
ncbi:SDR family oxidoreductase [Rhodovulum sp. DZ06]|uniref:SDR family oxidoreductase n=1 Tax=Rhodovulum sp. DZ06 TaxID=3425126 RepID=UPI003D34167A